MVMMEERKAPLGLMATATADRLQALWEGAGLSPDYTMLRQPETGAVMVRGRAGSTGDAFNMGEMTVTRASLKLANGTIGHGWCQGRSRRQATLIALVDAMMQTENASQLDAAILAPLREARSGRTACRNGRARCGHKGRFLHHGAGRGLMTTTLEGGFASASEDSARIFRSALNAMARPGQIEAVRIAPPSPRSAAAGALLLTLADRETPVFLAGAYDCAGLREWLAFHTGASFVGRMEAAFAVGTWSDLAPIDAYRTGTSEYPDRAVTLIVEMDELSRQRCAASGPGIESHASLNLLTQMFSNSTPRASRLASTCALVAGGNNMAALRSTRLAKEEGEAACMLLSKVVKRPSTMPIAGLPNCGGATGMFPSLAWRRSPTSCSWLYRG